MTVTPDHFLEGVQRDLLPGGSPMNTRRCLVVHHTSGATAQSSIDFWKSSAAKGASAHVIIDRDGTIFQCRPFNRTCGHAGVSRWKDPGTGRLFTGLNSCSIGIELANAGDDAELAMRWTKLPLVRLRHRNGGPAKLWEAFPAAQTEACTEVCAALVARYNLDDITSHDAIAPERKNDVGPAFDLLALRKACGFKGLPVVHWP